MKHLFLKIGNLKFFAYLFGLSGFILYTSKTIPYAFHLNSIIDEGLFLLKGIYFTNGSYTPYQEYGFWMNKMPFGYLFSGWLQNLFGPGLQTGRVAAIFFGVLSLLGIWLLIHRLTHNPWLAGLAVWGIALNNSLIQIYSQWFSEVLVACLMTWMLFFVLGKHRQTWQLFSGGVLLGLIIITRQNLLPLLFLIPLYRYWETKQWKSAGLVGLPALVLFVFIHAIYWPNILQMWLPWLPQPLTPFLDRFRIQLPGQPFYQPLIPFQTRLHAFWEAVRIHFIPLMLSTAVLVLLTEKNALQPKLETDPNFKLFVFLPLSCLLLTAEHFFATIMLDYCVYCFSMYLSFFIVFGMLSLIALPSVLREKTRSSATSLVLTAFFTLAVPTGVFYGTWRKLEDFFLHIQVPRSIQFDTVDLWVIFHNKYGWTEEFSMIALPTIAGFLLGLIILAASLWLVRRFPELTMSKITWIILLALGYLFLPSTILGAEFAPQPCNNIVQTTAKVGAEIQTFIPPDAAVYYAGGYSPAVMLYLSDIQIFPQQYEQEYSYYLGGDATLLEKYGYWNEDSRSRWIRQSDFILVSEKEYKDSMGELIHPDHFRQIYHSKPLYACVKDTSLMLFKRDD